MTVLVLWVSRDCQHTPLTTCRSLRESNISEHPRQIEYNIQDHEDVMNVMVVAGCYVDPASAS